MALRSNRRSAWLRGALLAVSALALLACDWVVGELPTPREDRAGQGGQGDQAGSSGAGGSAVGGSAVGGSAVGGSAVGGSTCAPCDCDADGFLAPACAGKDCDDHDPNVHPMQSEWFADANPVIGFDFDCNGKSEPREPTPVVCNALACDTVTQGFFQMVPACGKTGQYGTCKKDTLGCANDVRETNRRVLCH